MIRALRSLLLLTLVPLAALAASAPPAPYPDTAPGRRAAAYIEAFNRGNEDASRAFFTAHLAADAAAKRPLDERISMNRRLRQEHGTLTPVRALDSAPDHLQMRFTSSVGETMDLTFECEPQAPNGLLGIRIAMEAGAGDAGGPPPAPGPRPSQAKALATWP